MVKVFALLPRRPDINEQRFHDHWAGTHAELAMRITTLRSYIQSHRVPPGVAGLAAAPYEGIAELWFEDAETAAGMAQDPNYVNYAEPDIPNFIDGEHLAFVMTHEHVARSGRDLGKRERGIKLMLLLRRARAVSPEGLASRQNELGSRLADLSPHASRVTLAVALPESYLDGAEPAFDAIVELRFAGSEEFRSGWDADARGVLGELAGTIDRERSCGFLAEELRVIWPDVEPAEARELSGR